MASVHGFGAWVVHCCMVVVHGFGVSINDVVYYLDGGVVGLVRLDLGIGVWFWMMCGNVISQINQHLPHHLFQPTHLGNLAYDSNGHG